ncbi:MAG: thiamine-phosphate kinase [Acidobacteria bacterium]|nr:thiamine-phosphate kinase [Acidobacteriota bacterium]
MKPGRWITPGNAVDTVGALGEAAIIQRVRDRVPQAPDWVQVGIGDDAAVIEPQRGTLDVLTTDTLVAGIHFDFAFVPPGDVGHKTLAVNLSDLAAMGAEPRAALLSLVLPRSMATADLDAVLDGMLALAAHHGVALVGGNVTRTDGPLVLGVTAVGSVRRRRVLTRAGARPGDELWVTGVVGAAAAGLACLQHDPSASWTTVWDSDLADCVLHYRRPEPRVRIGMLLGRNKAARATVDLSDGLADGLRQLTSASGVGAVVDGSAVPIAPGAVRWFEAHGLDPLEAALAGGDDYELLMAVPSKHRRRFAAIRQQARGVPFTRIGEFTTAPDLVLRTASGTRALPAGYEHFRSDESSVT